MSFNMFNCIPMSISSSGLVSTSWRVPRLMYSEMMYTELRGWRGSSPGGPAGDVRGSPSSMSGIVRLWFPRLPDWLPSCRPSARRAFRSTSSLGMYAPMKRRMLGWRRVCSRCASRSSCSRRRSFRLATRSVPKKPEPGRGLVVTEDCWFCPVLMLLLLLLLMLLLSLPFEPPRPYLTCLIMTGVSRYFP